MLILTAADRAKLEKSGLIKSVPPPAAPPPPRLPDHVERRGGRRWGRIEVLIMIEAELREKVRRIQLRQKWRKIPFDMGCVEAFEASISVVRDHHVLSREGKPMREKS